ncbi:hypothetical protein BDN72DRAFT_866650 [Pluteus cervinus]|uniref:Uncharacterized protein n=1 Tax=Pluteus cervinus TaxID=181527 RepID=A0ACD3BI99_9AGAR|nr:hypothetical protein BDN72DRAFT_866650 [Pluteus cervinus]
MPQKDSPNRRRSIAAAGHSKPSTQKSRRRAYSIVGGDRLSPLAKARRSLVPRKSILKGSTAAQNPEQSSQGSTVIRGDASRKSLSRRVSFAESTWVRLSIPSTKAARVQFAEESPESSPTAQPDGPVTDENAYPGSSRRRRSSVRYSMAGSEDMDLTTVIPNADMVAGSTGEEEDSYDGDDMDMTQVVPSRGRSSVGGRQPLSQLQTGDGEAANESYSYSEEDSQAQSDMSQDHSEHIDFQIPITQSLRPANQDEVWLALRRMTEGGDTSVDMEEEQDEEEFDDGAGIDLEDARQRLLVARDSLPQSSQDTSLDEGAYPVQGSYAEASFTSTDDSLLADEGDLDGNKTLNMSRVLQRQSLGGLARERLSMGYQEMSMEESEIYGSVVPVLPEPEAREGTQPAQPPAQSTTEPSQAVLSKSTVFHPPTSEAPTPSLNASVPPGGRPPAPTEQPTKFPPSVPFTFTAPTMASQAKTIPKLPQKSPVKPTFSAAFAPPVARPTPRGSIGANPPSSPSKRPRPNNEDDAIRPSPAKRLAVASKWSDNVASPAGPSTQSPKPKPLSPSKRAPFQAAAPTGPASRRPSGYFARRKSLGVGLSAKVPEDSTKGAGPSKTLPKKNSVGRASLGGTSSTPWTRPQKSSQLVPTQEEVHIGEVYTPPPDTQGPEDSPMDPLDEEEDLAPAVLDMSAKFQQMSDPMEPEEEPAVPMSVGNRAGELYSSTRQWRERVEPTASEDDEETPPVSIDQFFELTGITFMDHLAAPRRSLHPSQQLRSQPRKQEEIPLAEYAIAVGIDVPQLALFTNISRELQNWMEKSKVEYMQAEDEATKLTPELFTEYVRADDEGKAELRHQLLLIRTHSRESAKADWYKWKHEWVNGLRVTAQQAFDSLESDARVLQGLQTRADELIPSLEQEYASIMRELEQEEAEIKEVERCDQGYLTELKVSLAEQGGEIEILQNDLSERKSTLQFSQEKLQELEAQRAEATAAIANAQRTLNMQQNGTRSEVFRLKEELEALEELHRFRLTKATPELVEYVYGSHFFVSIPCKKFIPTIKKISITRYEKTRYLHKDDFPELSDFFLRTAPKLLFDPQITNLQHVVRCLADYWTSCSQLRSQLNLLNIRYPISFQFNQPGDPGGFKVTAKVMLPRVHAKALISFLFPLDLFSKWPESLDGLDCEVTVGYGPIDRSAIIKAVIDHLATRNPSENYACLLDACIDAQALYA